MKGTSADESPDKKKSELYGTSILLTNAAFSLVLSFFCTFFTNSLTIKSDVFSAVLDVIFYAIIFLIILKTRKIDKTAFNYGTGKIEAFIYLLTGVLIFVYVVIMIKLTYGQLTTMESFIFDINVIYLYFVIFAKNIAALWLMNKIIGKRKSLISESGSMYALTCIFDNIVVLSPFLLYLIFSSATVQTHVYFDIGAAVVLCLSNLYYVFPMLKTAIHQLLDKSLEESLQLKILSVLAKYYDEYNFFIRQYTRQAGETKYVELHLGFDLDLKHGEVLTRMEKIKEGIEEEIPNCFVNIVPEKYK